MPTSIPLLPIPLFHAVICADEDCAVVWDRRASRSCPVCGFALHILLGRVLNRRAAA
jgi:hypothetical protein